jgi:hypothetical protein
MQAAIRRAAGLAAVLLDTPDVRVAMGAAAAQLVDGHGTTRVVSHLRALVLTHPTGRERHAA